jgi:hypothetical protein
MRQRHAGLPRGCEPRVKRLKEAGYRALRSLEPMESADPARGDGSSPSAAEGGGALAPGLTRPAAPDTILDKVQGRVEPSVTVAPPPPEVSGPELPCATGDPRQPRIRRDLRVPATVPHPGRGELREGAATLQSGLTPCRATAKRLPEGRPDAVRHPETDDLTRRPRRRPARRPGWRNATAQPAACAPAPRSGSCASGPWRPGSARRTSALPG